MMCSTERVPAAPVFLMTYVCNDVFQRMCASCSCVLMTYVCNDVFQRTGTSCTRVFNDVRVMMCSRERVPAVPVF